MRQAPEIPPKIRHVRLITKVAKYLAEVGPKNSREILEFVNTTSRHGSSMNELGNVLAKTRFFRKCNYMERVASYQSGSYDIEVWDIVEDEVTE